MIKFGISFLLVSIMSFNLYGQKKINEDSKKLSNEQKIYGLSKLWSEVKYNFANFDISEIDWDATYQEYIPRILETRTNEEYYKELMRMMALLKDGHSNVYYSPLLMDKKPPLSTELIEERIIITDIYNDKLREQGIEIGDEILEIDNRNAIAFAQKEIKPFESASTEHNLNVRVYSYKLLTGKENEPVKLKIKKKNGSVFTTDVSRKLNNNSDRSSFELRMMEQGIAYLKINDFANQKYKEVFDTLYPKILNSKSLIIDIRENGGGNGQQGFYILSHLIDRPMLKPQSSTKQYIPTFRAWGRSDMTMGFIPETIEPINLKEKYLKPVIVLTNAFTFSAAEDFAVTFDAARRGLIVGQSTGGSTGQPLIFDLPGDGFARVCTKRDRYPNGKEFIGIGVIPNIEISKTIESVRENQDIQLQRAVQEIKKRG